MYSELAILSCNLWVLFFTIWMFLVFTLFVCTELSLALISWKLNRLDIIPFKFLLFELFFCDLSFSILDTLEESFLISDILLHISQELLSSEPWVHWCPRLLFAKASVAICFLFLLFTIEFSRFLLAQLLSAIVLLSSVRLFLFSELLFLSLLLLFLSTESIFLMFLELKYLLFLLLP